MEVFDPLLMSCTTLLVGLHPLLMHGTALRTALLVVLHPFFVCLPVLHPPLVCPHAPKVHCPALLALPAPLQKGCTALFVGCDQFRPALIVAHACNMLPASSQALLVRCPALLALLALLQISSIALLVVVLRPLLMHGTALLVEVLRHLLMSCTTLLVGLHPLRMHGTALRTALLVVLHPFLVCLPVLHPPLVCPHAPNMHCPALLALPAPLQKGCTALFVGCDQFRPALLVSHACNMLPASSQALLVRCPALLALLAL